ncbi:beta-eliminating lyase-related protein [Frankia casuarinae]|uniref:beta-eliminating lyase-related protein n=1 Tax=Frankia TaxID=1854 RepID=UPI000460B2E4|nr:L-threonine aldolase [Frankia sp. BMG5.23]
MSGPPACPRGGRIRSTRPTVSGGRVWSLGRLAEFRAIADSAGVTLHCDGARLWNAAVASAVPPRRLAAAFTTLSVCLSKGLGAPVGSLVVCDAGRVGTVREWRRRLGGGMRQAGVLAAAGLHAPHHHVDRLAEDHQRAAELAALLADAAPGRVDPKAVESNMVLVQVTDAGADSNGPALGSRNDSAAPQAHPRREPGRAGQLAAAGAGSDLVGPTSLNTAPVGSAATARRP